MNENARNDMELINKLSRRTLTEEEVYTFPVILCDNETDRDCERFSISALKALSEMFVGKTGIFDHDPKGANQTARIYSAEVVSDPERRTRSGEVYTYVRAMAYLMRTDKNADFIKEIDGGIKKEVSVCCSVKREVCSICGADKKSSPCSHVKGSYYGGKLCEGILDEPTDAYEWSFVAIPAQPNAGVTKAVGSTDAAEIKSLRKRLDESAAEISKARREITAEIVRLGQFCIPAYDGDTIKSICSRMSMDELIGFKERTRKQAKPEAQHSVLSTGCEKRNERSEKSPFAMLRR